MKITKFLSHATLLQLVFLFMITNTSAQIGRIGINTTTPAAMLHVQDSSVVFSSSIFMSPELHPPISVEGTRMMWYPARGAFRTGTVTGARWSRDSIGINSFAAGSNSVASEFASFAVGSLARATGYVSFATGYLTKASNDYCFATGYGSIASGRASFATGYSAKASGDYSFAAGFDSDCSGSVSTAFGFHSISTGPYSFASGHYPLASGHATLAIGDGVRATQWCATALGNNTHANTRCLFAIGQYNDTTLANPGWSDSDHLFVIGNGVYENRRNALTVLKGGNIGITTSTPKAKLHITGGTEADLGEMSGYVVLGLTTGSNMVIDQNEIQVRNNGNTGHLALQTEGGNVGIGNASPSVKLHITGGSDASVNNAFSGFSVFGFTSSDNIVIDNNEILARNNNAGSTLYLQSSASAGDLSLCDVSGRVGIGNPNPSSRLHVNRGSDASLTSHGYLQLGGTDSLNIVIDNNELLARNNGSASNLILQADGGNVAVGSGSPSSKLHVTAGAEAGLGTHGFLQLGPTNSSNLVFDQNEILARNNGAAADMGLQVDGGEVGIGNSTPASKLHITGGSQLNNYSSAGYTVLGPTNGINLAFDEQNILARNNGSATTLYLQYLGGNLSLTAGGGKVTIGSVAATEEFNVAGDGVFTGTVTASCGPLSCSDIRYKTNIKPIENALQNVKALQGITYDWDRVNFPEKQFNDRPQIGLSAQELEKIYPEMVFTDANGYKTVDYSRLTPVLIEAVKELSAEVEELKMILKMQEED